MMKQQQPVEQDRGYFPSPRTIALIVALIFLLVSNIYLLTRLSRLQSDSSARDQHLREQLTSLQQESMRSARYSDRALTELRAELEKVSDGAGRAASGEARRATDRVVRTIAVRQREQQEYLIGELQGVQSSNETTRSRVNRIGGDIEEVRGDLDKTKSNLDDAEAALTQTRGNLAQIDSRLGDQAEQIVELRRTTQRHLTAFELGKSDGRQRISEDVYLELKKSDPKKNRFTVEIMADDMTFRHKDIYANQPLEFYVRGVKRPYEMVVTAVNKDQIVGYIAKPGVQQLAIR